MTSGIIKKRLTGVVQNSGQSCERGEGLFPCFNQEFIYGDRTTRGKAGGLNGSADHAVGPSCAPQESQNQRKMKMKNTITRRTRNIQRAAVIAVQDQVEVCRVVKVNFALITIDA